MAPLKTVLIMQESSSQTFKTVSFVLSNRRTVPVSQHLKWDRVAFVCFPGRDGIPYCETDYHAQFGIRCDSCSRFISGRVLEVRTSFRGAGSGWVSADVRLSGRKCELVQAEWTKSCEGKDQTQLSLVKWRKRWLTMRQTWKTHRSIHLSQSAAPFLVFCCPFSSILILSLLFYVLSLFSHVCHRLC